MDREIDMPAGWQGAWLDRTHEGFYNYSTLTFNILAIAAAVLGVKALFRLRQTRAELIESPSSRAAIHAANSAYLHKITRGQFYISTIFLLHAAAFYFVDTAISVNALWDDASENPGSYSGPAILELAIYTVGMLAIFTSVFLLFPLLQIILGFKLLSYRHRTTLTGTETLAEYIPSARTFTTQIGLLWSIAAFLLMMFWPMSENPTTRIIVLEAVFGSAIIWSQLSFGLNFRFKQFEGMEVQELLGGNREALTKYGTQIFSVHVEGLPKYETVAQSEPSLDEKSGA